MTVPFYPPAGNGQPQQNAPQNPVIVRAADGRSYMQTPQGMVPVNITPATGAGDPSQAQVPNQAPPAQYGNNAPAQPQQLQGVPTTQGMTPDTILRGPAFEPWMQGRTLGQVMQMVKPMQEAYVRQQQNGSLGQPQPQAQPQAPQAQQQPNGQAQPMDARAFYSDPVANTRKVVEQTLREVMQPMLQPVLQQNAQSAAQAAQAQFLQRYPAAAQLMPQMMPLLQRSTAEQLANQDTWDAIYRYALGQAVLEREGQMLGGQGQGTQQPAGYNPPPQPPQQWNEPARVTPHGMFFSEGSTPSPASLGAQPNVSAAQLTPYELATARASGITPEQYAQSKADLAWGRMPSFGMAVGQTPGGRQW